MTDDLSRRTLGCGISLAGDTDQAATESVRAALDGRAPTGNDLVLVFPTSHYEPQRFLDAAVRAAGPAQVVGCTSYAAFTAEAHVTQGAVAAYLPAAELSFGIAAEGSLSTDIFSTARRCTKSARDRAGGRAEHSVLLLLSDAIAGDQREVVRGSYLVTGATVPLVGGAAAEDSEAVPVTYQFAEGRAMTDGLVAVWINSPYPLGIGVDHGWYPIGEPMIVTRAEENVIHELDGRPAAEVYLANRGNDFLPLEIAGRAFARATYDHPLGIATTSGRFEIRHILNRTDSGALVMFGHLSEQSVVNVMAGEAQDLVKAAGRAAGEAVGQLVTPPRGGLVFSCTGRVPALGAQVTAEAAAAHSAMGGTPICGFYTYGEFARVTGSTGFHNATVAVLAV